jgi:hypothetical protein
MDLKILETAITELAQDQKDTNLELVELAKRVKETGEKVEAFSEILTNHKVTVPATDTGPITRQNSEFFQKVSDILAAQPKNVIHQRRLLLFPADNADYYYRIIFGRLFGWAVLFLVCTYLYSLSEHYIEKSTAASNRRYYYETYQDAWNRLDSTLGPTGRKKMEEAMQKAVRDQ